MFIVEDLASLRKIHIKATIDKSLRTDISVNELEVKNLIWG